MQVLEFIATEHTAKNLMIRAVRTQGKDVQQSKQDYVAFRDAWSLEQPFIEAVFGSILD